MFLLLRLFNSFFFFVVILTIGIYTLQRFFRAMVFHCRLIHDVEEYSSVVEKSRSSLQYVGRRVSEAMKEMEMDIEKEVYMTYNLTKLAPKIASVSKRFADLEEGIIELASRANMENVLVETPANINDEVLRILRNVNKPSSPQVGVVSEPTTPVADLERTTSSRRQLRRAHSTAPGKFASAVPVRKTIAKHPVPRSPGGLAVTEVSLLTEQPNPKPIGFRPPWMCPA